MTPAVPSSGGSGYYTGGLLVACLGLGEQAFHHLPECILEVDACRLCLGLSDGAQVERLGSTAGVAAHSREIPAVAASSCFSLFIRLIGPPG